MEIIEQTNKTVLFDEINPEKYNILTLIGETRNVESLSDEKVQEINAALCVSSFDEFLYKFSPTVYSYFDAAGQRVLYTLKKPDLPENFVTEIPITEGNDFLKMLTTLMSAKRAQGTVNVDFKFENLLDLISPGKVIEDIKQTRQEIHYTYDQYETLEEDDPKKLDVGDKLNKLFEEASANYNNALAMLPLAIEDAKTRLLLGGEQASAGGEPLRIGTLSMSEGGELKILELPKTEKTALVTTGGKSEAGLVTAFEEDFYAVNEEENASPYLKALVVRTFCPLAAASAEIDVEKEAANYNSYLEFYKKSKDDFIKCVKPLIEKILGVKCFFDQYDVKSKEMQPKLLITNTSLDMLTKTSNLARFNTYLKTVNCKNDFSNTIWFGIVPSVDVDASGKRTVTRERFKGHEKAGVGVVRGSSTLENLGILLDAVKDYRVQIFYSFRTGEDTTFDRLATEGVDQYVSKSAPLMRRDFSEFAVPCLPNFTVIPKERSGVILDKAMEIDENGVPKLSENDIQKLWIEGIYVGAAYVAAGCVAAYQCPQFLKEKKFKPISPEYPGVRFDVEHKNNALQIPTTMAKEIYGLTENVKSSINRKGFGFVFSSENAKFGKTEIKNVTVYKARSLSEVDNEFESVYKTLVSTYIHRILTYVTNDMKEDNIAFFFSNNPDSQKSKWMATSEYVNSVLQKGDELSHSIDVQNGRCDINISLSGSTRNLDVLISRSKAAV
ncbi:MAG: transcriptional regulator [Clostridiales Family XIII bacterium]|jgi:hypothetical protein|nr:transcriptional regulator [Clostridiales Family XIII bacterium]